MRNRVAHVGVGCFAESDTLRRVFRRALENFLLSKYEEICTPADRALNDKNLTRFFNSVIHSGTGKPDHVDPASKSFPESAKITGFYLGLNQQTLHLVVFFLDGGLQQTRWTTRLEKFTRLRQKHLH